MKELLKRITDLKESYEYLKGKYLQQEIHLEDVSRVDIKISILEEFKFDVEKMISRCATRQTLHIYITGYINMKLTHIESMITHYKGLIGIIEINTNELDELEIEKNLYLQLNEKFKTLDLYTSNEELRKNTTTITPEKYEIQKTNDRFVRYSLSIPKSMARINYTINLDRFELFVSGEARGSYKWLDKNAESFIEMISSSDERYLLEKLFKCDVFDLGESINQICNVLEDYYDEEYADEMIGDIQDNVDAVDKYDLLKQIYSLTDIEEGNDIEIDTRLEECISYDYRWWDKEACRLFIGQIIPLLKMEVLNNEK